MLVRSSQPLLSTAPRQLATTSAYLSQHPSSILSFSTSSSPSSSETPPSNRKHSPLPLHHTSPLSPKPSPPSPQKSYSPLTISIVKGLARVMGYNSTTSAAIRVTSDLYDRCAERPHIERHFWYKQCALPETYQTWFQLTNLHIYLLLVRFRALPPDQAKIYSQELVNHFFIDAESRMRDRFGVQTSRLVKGYMRDMHMQHRGSVLGLDEGLVGGDHRLAQAIWRNVWGAGWGTVAGVKRKLEGVDRNAEGEKDDPEGEPELARDLASFDPELEKRTATSPYARAAATRRAEEMANKFKQSVSPPTSTDAATFDSLPEMTFPIHLLRVTKFIRRETNRLAELSDDEIRMGIVQNRGGSKPPTTHPNQDPRTEDQGGRDQSGMAKRRSEEAAYATRSIASFGKI